MTLAKALIQKVRSVGILGASVIALSAGAASAIVFQRAGSPKGPQETLSGDQLPQDGIEEVAVLIGASWCSASKVPGFASSIRGVMATLHKEARTRGHAFSTVGVSLDWGPKQGMRWLDTMGAFDELIVGRNWGNDAAIQYVWRDPHARPAVPQLVLLRRHVLRVHGRIEFGSDSVLERIVGPALIMKRASLRR